MIVAATVAAPAAVATVATTAPETFMVLGVQGRSGAQFVTLRCDPVSGTHPHPEVSSRAGSHRPALAEPDLNLSTHPAPIAQPSGRNPNRQ
jgi:hypothetical protein